MDIKTRRLQLGYTMLEVGKMVGVSEATVSRWENGHVDNMKRDKIYALSKLFDMSPLEVMGFESDSEPAIKSKRIPIVGIVTAGTPIDRIEVIDGYESIPDSWSGDYFALRIKGDSMMPRIEDGDVVIVRKQHDAEDGEIVIAAVNGDEATCKRLRKQNGTIMLQPNNPAYFPIVWDGRNGPAITIIGKVVELRSRF